MTSGSVLWVCGFPTELPPERVADKLTIHFQRSCNGGGEIANIEFSPESPDCAMVTFEKAAVAQRVLKTATHVLTIGGKTYPLQVSPCMPGLDPNKIFVHVSMKVDYGHIPGGKEILQNLCKQYGDIVFKFCSQEMTCLAEGPFTHLQAFSSELLRCFQSKQRNATPDQNSMLDERRSSDKIGSDKSSLQGVPNTQAEKKGQKAAHEGPPPRNPMENHTELLEDFFLVMDSYIFLYMEKFCQKELGSILREHRVHVVEFSSEGIATVYLQTASGGSPGGSSLASAHLALSQLSQQLEATLRKEKISWRPLGGVESTSGLRGELQRLFPRLLCHQDEEHLCLIGNTLEVLHARQHVLDFITARKAAEDCQKPDVPQAVNMAQIHGTAGPKVSDLGRPDSFSLPQPQHSRDSANEPLPVARINPDRLQQSSQEQSRRVLLEDVIQEGRGQEPDLQIPKQHLLSSTLPVVQRDGVSQEGPSTAQGLGVFAGPPNHISECFGSSQLAVEEPEDEALADLGHSLKACQEPVAINRERHPLALSYPRGQQSSRSLRRIAALRRAVLTQQFLPLVTPRKAKSRKMNQRLRSERVLSRRGRAALREHPPRHLGRLAGENLSSQVQRFPDASQTTVEQNFPSDGRAWLSRKLAPVPVAGKEGCSGEPVTEAQQGLPGRFCLARDSSLERFHRGVEGASWSELLSLVLPQNFGSGGGSAEPEKSPLSEHQGQVDRDSDREIRVAAKQFTGARISSALMVSRHPKRSAHSI